MSDDLRNRLRHEIEVAWDAFEGPSTRDERLNAAVDVAVAEVERARREALEKAGRYLTAAARALADKSEV